MKILAFDTSTELCSAALWLDGELIEREEMAGNRHSELLLPMIQYLLAEAGLALPELDGLAFGKGPGSFTGLRIGCGVAQGLAFAADLPVHGVTTLAAMAQETMATSVLSCIDARMHEVYVAAYRRQGDALEEVVAPRVLPPERVDLPDAGGWTGVGTGFSAYPALLHGRLIAVDPLVHPRARAIAHLARPVLVAGGGVPAESAEPFYVRDKVALKTVER